MTTAALRLRRLDLDWLHAALVSLSLASHVGFALWARWADFPVDFSTPEMPERWLPPPVFVEPAPAAAPAAAPAPAPAPAAAPAPVPAPAPAPVPTRPGVLDVLASLRAGGGDVADLLAGGRDSTSLDEVLAQIDALQPGGEPRGPLDAPAGGDGRVASLGALRGGRSGDVAAGAAIQATPRVRIAPTPPHRPGPGVLPWGDVRRIVRAHLGAIQACYERSLRHDPTLQGRITVEVDVAASGGVSGAVTVFDSIEDPDVSPCVVSVLRRMRFPEPDCGPTAFSLPLVFLPGS